MNNQRTSLFLMANLGVEMSRLVKAKENKDSKLLSETILRVKNMLQKIKELPDMITRVKEVEILSYVADDIGKSRSTLKISSSNIDTYFKPFMLRLLAAK
jgi:cytolysin (calcineurin-like family phosphatase)